MIDYTLQINKILLIFFQLNNTEQTFQKQTIRRKYKEGNNR